MRTDFTVSPATLPRLASTSDPHIKKRLTHNREGRWGICGGLTLQVEASGRYAVTESDSVAWAAAAIAVARTIKIIFSNDFPSLANNRKKKIQ